MTAPIIKTIDIETSPIISYHWGLWKQNIGLSQILQDWTVLSYSSKTLGDRKVRYEDVSKQANFYDDRAIMGKLWTELDEADLVVTQNGIHFDHRKINARFIELGMKPPSPFKMIDTKVEASKVAMFTSNKLEWLSAKLTDTPKLKHAAYPGFDLWVACLKGDPKAWAEMKKYNIRDTEATEALYLKLRPWIKNHPNLNVYDEQTEVRCPSCGGTHLHKRGFVFTQSGKYQKLECQTCGAWMRTRYTENTTAKRKSLLASI
jgi:hypothetical protein